MLRRREDGAGENPGVGDLAGLGAGRYRAPLQRSGHRRAGGEAGDLGIEEKQPQPVGASQKLRIYATGRRQALLLAHDDARTPQGVGEVRALAALGSEADRAGEDVVRVTVRAGPGVLAPNGAQHVEALEQAALAPPVLPEGLGGGEADEKGHGERLF